MMSFAARPPTQVDPMWSMRSASAPELRAQTRSDLGEALCPPDVVVDDPAAAASP